MRSISKDPRMDSSAILNVHWRFPTHSNTAAAHKPQFIIFRKIENFGSDNPSVGRKNKLNRRLLD